MYETQQYKDLIGVSRRGFQAGYVSKDAAESLVKAGKAFAYLANMKSVYELQATAQSGNR